MHNPITASVGGANLNIIIGLVVGALLVFTWLLVLILTITRTVIWVRKRSINSIEAVTLFTGGIIVIRTLLATIITVLNGDWLSSSNLAGTIVVVVTLGIAFVLNFLGYSKTEKFDHLTKKLFLALIILYVVLYASWIAANIFFPRIS